MYFELSEKIYFVKKKDFVMNSTEQMSKLFSRSRDNKNSRNGDIRTDIFFILKC